MMTPKQRLKSIDSELGSLGASIENARARIKELHDERKNVAHTVVVEENQENFARVQKEGQNWKENHPKEHAKFLNEIRQKNKENVIEGLLSGWWDLDDDGNMAAPVLLFRLSEFNNVKNPTLAHVMAKAGIFSSIGQARKNGWSKPLVEGKWTVTKKKIRIKVIS